jgi:hypothetical protein
MSKSATAGFDPALPVACNAATIAQASSAAAGDTAHRAAPERRPGRREGATPSRIGRRGGTIFGFA